MLGRNISSGDLKKYGIARSTLYIWLKSHTSQSTETIRKRDHFRLKQKCDQQEKAIEILCFAFNAERYLKIFFS
jgi:hypothetical protein